MKPCVLRALLTLMLALAVGASGTLRAFAHGRDAGLTAMVICGEGETTTVYLDVAGNRVDPDKTCLTDACSACALAKSIDLPDLAAPPVPPGHARALASKLDPDQPVMRWTSPATARGPPN